MKILTALLAGASAAGLTTATQAQPPSQPVGDTPVARSGDAEILVTGTRFRDRTVTTSPVPVDVLRGEDLRTSGYQETTEVLRQLTPSFAFATPTTPDGNTQIHAASLRGLSPDETLVLVNGKRLHGAGWVNTGGTIGKGSVPTDLNQIPVDSIGRVEILRDGASAQYGSDAIAGVINIILRDDTAIHGSASAGTTYDGGGDTYNVSLGGGVKLGENGILNVTGSYRDHKGANRALPDTRQFYLGISPTGTPQALSASYGSGTGLNRVGGITGTVADPREATVDRNVWRFADEGDLKDASFIANLKKPLGPVELYGFGGYRVSKAHSNASFRRPGQDEVVRAIFPNGFLPFVNTKSTDYSASLGVRGDLTSNVQWDLSTIYGGNKIAYRTENTLNATLGAASPTKFYNGAYADTQWTTDLTLSTEQDLGLASPLRLAAGVEFRRDDYKITPGEPNSYINGGSRILDGPNAGAVPTIGSQGFAGIQPGDAVDTHRNNVGLFLDGEVQPIAGWTINGAGRYEHYSDFGSTWTAQGSTRVSLFDGFAARASIGTGFHAPALAQQNFSSTSSRTLIVGGFPQFVLVRTAPPGSSLARALGAQDLKPEKSTNYSAGLTYGKNGFSASVDYYHIDINNRIFLSSNYVDATGSSRLRDYLTSVGIPGVTSVRYFTNAAADTRTQGVDVTVAYGLDLAKWGAFRLSAGYNHNATRLRRIAATPSQVTALGITTPLFDVIERTRVERGQPQDKITLGGNWKIGAITFDARTTRYGEVRQVALTSQAAAQVALVGQGSTPYYTLATESGTAGNFDVIQKLRAKWVTDFSFTGQVTRNFAVTFGANNIFNVYPTKVIVSTAALSGADTSGVFPYSEFSPFGFSGAFYYARVGFSF